MIFIAMLLAAAISLAAAAGYFSVSGLSETYAASFISIIIMGTCLEASKLVLASFIHKFWDKLNFVLKGMYSLMLIILMFITSYGVFSHLTSAYQRDSVPLTQISQQLQQDKTELDRLIARKSQMDEQIAKLPNSYAKARTQLIKSFGEEYTNVPTRINLLTKEISELNSNQLSTEAKIGPIIYMAKVLNQDPDKTIFYFTFLITIVFDPLAVALIFAFNMAVEDRKKKRETIEKEIKTVEVDADVIRDTLWPPNNLQVSDSKESEPIELEIPEETITTLQESKEDVIGKMYSKLRNAKKPVN